MSDLKKTFPYFIEKELLQKCNISKERFHKVRGSQWKGVYQAITEKFADKTKTWKNGLHWANVNGYSPKSMKNLVGCYPVDYSTWFYQLPKIVPKDDMAYFLIDSGHYWYDGEQFWIFESGILELTEVLSVLNQSSFLGLGRSDYYIVSKKYKWIIGFNHHDVVSLVGEGLNAKCFLETKN